MTSKKNADMEPQTISKTELGSPKPNTVPKRNINAPEGIVRARLFLTPISALIHAATMVTAGIFMVSRMSPLYEMSEVALSFVMIIGAITAFFMGLMGIIQNDIKRVVAYSTLSQLGYMTVALGASAYSVAVFHLMTHAFFKALLFLGAGSVIIGMHHDQDIRHMGGLRKYMPITHVTFLICCLAIAGVPGLSGFFSKDEIITACFHYSPVLGWWMTMVAAMTAFYMFRLYYGIFWGKDNEAYAEHRPHEAPWTMTLPLIVLSAVTLVGGWIPFGHFVSAAGTAYDIHLDAQIAITSSVIALLSIGLATYIYMGKTQPVADKLEATFPRLHRWAYKRFYMDEVYQFVTHRIIFRYISRPIAWFDRHVIDGFFDFLAWGTQRLSLCIRGLQNGSVQSYAFVFAVGALLVFLIMIL